MAMRREQSPKSDTGTYTGTYLEQHSKSGEDDRESQCSPLRRGTGKPDPHALATARAVQETVNPDTVILFGSRARGDYQPQSDLDLLLVGNDSPPGEAERTARQYMRENPPEMEVEVIRLSRDEFTRAWRAKQHIAG